MFAMFVCSHVSAEVDTFSLGSGRQGAGSITGAGTNVNSYTALTANVTAGSSNLTVSNGTLFAPGDLIMLYQASGFAAASGDQSTIDLSLSSVGGWEFARVQSSQSNLIVVTSPLVKAFNSPGSQVIGVPEYTSLTVASGASVAAKAWNGISGGVVAFLVSGKLTLTGSILATGAGFRGGPSVNSPDTGSECTGLDQAPTQGGQKGEGLVSGRYGSISTGSGNLANGGGGGNCRTFAGGGGGNGGMGGHGAGNLSSGYGGAVIDYSGLDHLTFGGGGGGGHGNAGGETSGASGGGIVFIRAGQLEGGGKVDANGIDALPSLCGTSCNDGAGGGGAGGSIYLRTVGSATCGILNAKGGIGGSTFQGNSAGGGGGGRIVLQAPSGSSCPVSVLAGTCGTTAFNGCNNATPASATDPSYAGVSTIFATPLPQLPAPIFVSPSEGSLVSSRRFPISGTASPGAQVVVYLDGAQLALANADNSGNFSTTPLSDLTAGPHVLTAAATAQDVYSPLSIPVHFQITSFGTPVITLPSSRQILSTSTPTISGMADFSTLIDVKLNDLLRVTVTSSATGVWTYTVTEGQALSNGIYIATAQEKGTNGISGPPFSPGNFCDRPRGKCRADQGRMRRERARSRLALGADPAFRSRTAPEAIAFLSIFGQTVGNESILGCVRTRFGDNSSDAS